MGLNRISVGGVLGGLGNENDDHGRVDPAHGRSRAHAVDPAHLDVEKDQVEVRLVVLEELGAVAELADDEGGSGARFVVLEQCDESFAVALAVVHNSHVDYLRIICRH